LDRFRITPYGLYDVRVLNSGVTLPGHKIVFKPESFSFLKLHGTVGGWTNDLTGSGHPLHQRVHFEAPIAPGPPVEDRYFFSEPPNGPHPDHLKRPPLLFFPYQRQFIALNETRFPFHVYASEVWKRATELISKATEIHAIGYSFSGIDRGPMLDILNQASSCRRLIIQGLDADFICQKQNRRLTVRRLFLAPATTKCK